MAKTKMLCGFGQYKGKKLSWIILERQGDKALVLAWRPLYKGSFLSSGFGDYEDKVNFYNDGSWNWSPIKEYLNGKEKDKAGGLWAEGFTDGERKRILLADDRPEDFVCEGGQPRKSADEIRTDGLFLLTRGEVKRYIPSEKKRKCGEKWWVRDSKYASKGMDCAGEVETYFVAEDGTFGSRKDGETPGVRPAMWVRCSPEEETDLETFTLPRRNELLAEKERLTAKRKKTEESASEAEWKVLRRLREEWNAADADYEKKKENLEKVPGEYEWDYKIIRPAEEKAKRIPAIFFLHKIAACSKVKKLKKQKPEGLRLHEIALEDRDAAWDIREKAQKKLEACKAFRVEEAMKAVDRQIQALDEELSLLRD